MVSSGSSLGGMVAMFDCVCRYANCRRLCVERRKIAMLWCSCKELKSVRGKITRI